MTAKLGGTAGMKLVFQFQQFNILNIKNPLLKMVFIVGVMWWCYMKWKLRQRDEFWSFWSFLVLFLVPLVLFLVLLVFFGPIGPIWPIWTTGEHPAGLKSPSPVRPQKNLDQLYISFKMNHQQNHLHHLDPKRRDRSWAGMHTFPGPDSHLWFKPGPPSY